MTINEYKAWLEGFNSATKGKRPTEKQWKVIQDKLADVHDSSGINVISWWPYPYTTYTTPPTFWNEITCESPTNVCGTVGVPLDVPTRQYHARSA